MMTAKSMNFWGQFQCSILNFTNIKTLPNYRLCTYKYYHKRMGYRNEVLKKKALVLSWGPVWKAASKAETGWPFRSFLELRWPTLHAAFSLFSFFFFASTLQEQMVIGLVSWSSYKYYYSKVYFWFQRIWPKGIIRLIRLSIALYTLLK